MAKNVAEKCTAAASLLLLVALTACAPQEQSASRPLAPTPSASTEHAITLTDAPEADGYCGVVAELRERATVMAELDVSDQMSVLGTNLDYLSASMNLLGTYDAERSGAWHQASEAYAATSEFYAVSGEQIANDNLLVLLAEAVALSDAAYGQTQERALAECGVDVTPLMTPER